ncbi:Fur family transcriptional regulator [Opitutus terrae]|uniref:Ferric uptake regulator, Fur family n=1 Tax=Opitutus terrae (strain DSM 11246 / JCM 15787 / PB90-1) TaxID=452637 RepID=B1ZZE6_OPITP|nr:ferric uptake regulator family protein [Opitutus terrae]ACB76349.1 ferric uptake regulator, Fur family [Opitutus terrae PB90-1]
MSVAAIQPGNTDTHPQLDAALARLKAAGMRITQPRVAMLDALLHFRMPASVAAIHEAIGGCCDLITVRRSVGAMVDAGMVRRIFTRSATALHELSLDPERLYVVTKSGEILAPEAAVPTPKMRRAVQRVEDALRRRGYRSVSHLIQFIADPPTPAAKRRPHRLDSRDSAAL